MAKIYGTPVMAGGAGGMNKDLPPLLDNFKATAKDNISKNARGENLIISDSISSELQGLTVYGKSTQDGTPTPEAPITIVSAGDSGTITVTVSDGAEQSQTLPVSTPNGLPGIPVDSGGNYTDADGQQWICDEIDFARGKYTQKVGKTIVDGDKIKFRLEGKFVNLPQYSSPNMIQGLGVSDTISTLFPRKEIKGNGEINFCYLLKKDFDKYFSSIEECNKLLQQKYLNDDPLKIYYPTINIETDLTPEQLQAYAALKTYAPSTTIQTDSTPSAGIEVEYTSTSKNVELSANKMSVSRANELAGAVWVYGDHEPTSVNDGTKIQLTREEVVTSDGGEAQTVTKTVEWNIESNFFARQFTYNSKKQYQTMLEGAIATITLLGVPDPVSELAEQHSGSSITLTWKNPTSDELYDHTVVVYKTDAFPTAIDDGTQGYSGTDETATLSGLEIGSTYYIAVFTVSAYGLYGEPQTVQVEIPASLLLSSLASGTKVKFGKWNNTDLQWKVARDTSDQSIRLVLEPTSVSLLGNMAYDAKEPRNSDSNRKNYGNNRYIYSNIHQWLNATKATGWYVAQHSADAAPAYASSPGFLSGWSENHIAALDMATLTTSRARVDGGGTETFVARVALISTTELGLQNSTGGGRLDIFNANGDRAAGAVYWTRTPNPSSSYNAYQVTDAGGLNYGSVLYANGVRPLCIPVSTALVSLEMDDDGCYVVQ